MVGSCNDTGHDLLDNESHQRIVPAMFPLSEFSDSLDPRDESLINVWDIVYGKTTSENKTDADNKEDSNETLSHS